MYANTHSHTFTTTRYVTPNTNLIFASVLLHSYVTFNDGAIIIYSQLISEQVCQKQTALVSPRGGVTKPRRRSLRTQLLLITSTSCICGDLCLVQGFFQSQLDSRRNDFSLEQSRLGISFVDIFSKETPLETVI